MATIQDFGGVCGEGINQLEQHTLHLYIVLVADHYEKDGTVPNSQQSRQNAVTQPQNLPL